ncbi:MAG: phosphodiester glycosidase family protein [Desulfovibrionaceae bacterium]|nr:phosphodiester glycosidase family protein [Desulfovibrionaceae bacterium]
MILRILPVLLLALLLLTPRIQVAAAVAEAGSAGMPALTDAEVSYGPTDGDRILPVDGHGARGRDTDESTTEEDGFASRNSASGGSAGRRWQQLEEGLEYAEMGSEDFLLYVLRIDPAHFSFVLCAAGSGSGEPRTLREWGEDFNLSGATNASMYLPDGLTSTGYMRDGGYVNNSRLVQRFGAFFVAEPDDPDLPRATIIEKDNDIWKELLPHYRLVIQNYRMVNSQRRILWSPGGPLYSISAVAVDGAGKILFLHSRNPVEAYTFAQQLLHLPLNIRTVMYVEGGGQAGLLVRSKAIDREVIGRNAVDFLVTGNRQVKLPNVLGIRRMQ